MLFSNHRSGFGDGHQEQDVQDEMDLEHQELANEQYDCGFSAGFESGQKAAQDQLQQDSVYAAAFAAGQRTERERWLLEGGYAAAFDAGQQAERERAQLLYQETAQRDPGALDPGFDGALAYTQHFQEPSKPEAGFRLEHHNAEPQTATPDADGKVSCPHCGKSMRESSLLRHKRRRHKDLLLAGGEVMEYYPCWWPGCGMLQDNLVANQLSTHLQRKHNCEQLSAPMPSLLGCFCTHVSSS